MINSIRYFEEECVNRFEKLEDDFMKEPQKLAEYGKRLKYCNRKTGLVGFGYFSCVAGNCIINIDVMGGI